jgi:hypothetical protein
MEFWKVIEKMNFNGRGYEAAGRWLVEDSGLSVDEIIEVRNIAHRNQSALYNKLNAARIGSDDGFDDVLWQTIANGYEAFHNTTVEDLESMYNENRYTESFAYAFHIVNDIEEDNWFESKLAKQKQHIEDIRRGFGGGFVTKLVAAFDHADSGNRKKLAKGFPELFEFIVSEHKEK